MLGLFKNKKHPFEDARGHSEPFWGTCGAEEVLSAQHPQVPVHPHPPGAACGRAASCVPDREALTRL